MFPFLAFALLVAAAAFLGSRYKPDAAYRQLRKPAWNPPDAVFGPVWAVLYVGIAWAGYRAWRVSDGFMSPALAFWYLQLVLNVAWSWLFFGRHRIFGALVDVSLLFVAIVGFIVTIAPDDAVAAWLFVPYGAWVAFAAILNGTIWRMNGDRAPEPRSSDAARDPEHVRS